MKKRIAKFANDPYGQEPRTPKRTKSGKNFVVENQDL